MKRTIALACALLCLGAAPDALAAAIPSGSFEPGVVEPPPPGRALRGDVVDRAGASLSAAISDAYRQLIRTPDGYKVLVETSPGYIPNRSYDEEAVAFLDSLVHGPELDGLRVYVATPAEMTSVCGGAAAACYNSRTGAIAIVGQSSYGGIPTPYAVTHEYGHRIEAYRHNSPFQGGALAWGTKRWASVKHVCQGTVTGSFAPGDEGAHYFRNPGEAFAESYARLHFGSSVGGWRWNSALRPNKKAFDAIRTDVLHPWRPLRSERQGRVGGGESRTYVLRPKYDGRLRVRMDGGAGLGLRLLDQRGHPLQTSSRGGSRKRIEFVVCGERRLKLVVEGGRRAARFRLKLQTP